jgi:zinc protease
MKLDLAFGRRVLKNGAVCLAARNPTAPTFAAVVSILVDQRMEPAAKAGLGQLMGACLDEGTKRHTGDELAEIVEGFGGSIDGGMSGGSITAPLSELKKALPLLAEMLLSPSFPSNALERQRAITRSDIQGDLEEPRTVAFLKFKELCYGGHPYARPAKGTLKTIPKVTRADLVAFHRTWFGPGRAVIAASGDLEVERMLDLLEKTFGSWRNKLAEVPQAQAAVRPRQIVRTHLSMAREQVHVYLGHPGIRRTDPDFYRLSVMDHVLGTGPGFVDRISKKLRDEQGLAYTVSASITNTAGYEPGHFAAYIGTSPAQVDQAIDGFLLEIRRIRAEAPTDDEVRTVQDYLTGSFVLGLERNANLASYLVRCERYQLGLDFLERYPDIVRAITPEQVREVAEKHLDSDRYVLVTAGPAAKGTGKSPGVGPRAKAAAR